MSDRPSVKDLKNVIKNIQKIIKELDKKQIFGQEVRENYFFDNHVDIMSKYPYLVSHLCSGNDNSMLEIMFRHLEEVEVGEKTPEQADEIIGEKLVATYIKPEDKSR
jgi:hypothetical protein